jgi:hypothetical protein
MTFGSKRFEVKSNPWGNMGTPNLSNLSDRDIFDDERLKWMHTEYWDNQARFDPVSGKFYPNWGDLDGRGGGGRGRGGGGTFPETIPRISPINEGIFDESSNGCPYGFYQFGKVCVPNADMTKGGPGGLSGVGLSEFFGKGDAKGLINAITPPQFTAKNQEFIVMTDVQNIGGRPAKFYTKVSIPEINMTGDVSNSTMVMPLAKLKIGHRIIMPQTVVGNNLLNAKVELIRLPIDNLGNTTSTVELVDDIGQVSIPSPNYRGPLPPIGGGLVGGPTGSPYGGPLTGMGMPPPPFGGGGGRPPMGPPFGGPFPPQPPPPFGFPPRGPPPPIFFPRPRPGGGPPGMISPQIMVNPQSPSYAAGSTIYVTGNGFVPNENIAVQLYSVSNAAGIVKFLKRLTTQSVRAEFNGFFPGPVAIAIPIRPGTTKVAVVAYGDQSKMKVQQVLTLTGITADGGGFGGGFPFGDMFDMEEGGMQGWMKDLFDRIGIGNKSGQNINWQFPGGPNQTSNQSSNVSGGNIPANIRNMFPPGFPFTGGYGGGGSGGSNNNFINPAEDTEGFLDELFSRLNMER